jgi:integrase
MMSLERLRYVDRIPTASGTYYYFRRRAGRVKLPGSPGDPDFLVTYERLLRGLKPSVGKEPYGTFKHVIASYYESDEYQHLRDVTKASYRSVLERLREKHGHRSFVQMGYDEVTKLLALQRDKPGAAHMTLKLLRILVRHARIKKWITVDPTEDVMRRPIGSRRSWTDAEIELFEARWPIGTPERLAFALHLYLGQRRSDVARMCWDWFSHDLQNVTVWAQQKTGTKVTVPVHPDLHEILMATPGPRVGPVLIGRRGKKVRKAAYHGDFMRAAQRAAGLPVDCVLHGLRHTAGRLLAEAGCDIQEIMAVLGHVTVSQAQKYARDAERALQARSAIAKQVANRKSAKSRFMKC